MCLSEQFDGVFGVRDRERRLRGHVARAEFDPEIIWWLARRVEVLLIPARFEAPAAVREIGAHVLCEEAGVFRSEIDRALMNPRGANVIQ